MIHDALGVELVVLTKQAEWRAGARDASLRSTLAGETPARAHGRLRTALARSLAGVAMKVDPSASAQALRGADANAASRGRAAW